MGVISEVNKKLLLFQQQKLREIKDLEEKKCPKIGYHMIRCTLKITIECFSVSTYNMEEVIWGYRI